MRISAGHPQIAPAEDAAAKNVALSSNIENGVEEKGVEDTGDAVTNTQRNTQKKTQLGSADAKIFFQYLQQQSSHKQTSIFQRLMSKLLPFEIEDIEEFSEDHILNMTAILGDGKRRNILATDFFAILAAGTYSVAEVKMKDEKKKTCSVSISISKKSDSITRSYKKEPLFWHPKSASVTKKNNTKKTVSIVIEVKFSFFEGSLKMKGNPVATWKDSDNKIESAAGARSTIRLDGFVSSNAIAANTLNEILMESSLPEPVKKEHKSNPDGFLAAYHRQCVHTVLLGICLLPVRTLLPVLSQSVSLSVRTQFLPLISWVATSFAQLRLAPVLK